MPHLHPGSGEEDLSGTGALPVMDEVKQEARRRNIELPILPTAQASQTVEGSS
jgi:hypothetical protein